MPAIASLAHAASFISSFAQPFLVTFFLAAAALRAFKNVRVIGVTGSIASGKSSFCRHLRLHAPAIDGSPALHIVDADEIARSVTAPGAAL
jgi:putative protein kinase ArgK-like GTPase of G3E family